MKQIIFLIIALACFGRTNAQEDKGSQTSKGNIFLETNTGFAENGSTGFTFSTSDDYYGYNVGLDGGYFIVDDLAVKVGLGYGAFKFNDSNYSVLSYKVGAKYYFMKNFPVGIDLTGASLQDAEENPLWLGVQGGYAW